MKKNCECKQKKRKIRLPKIKPAYCYKCGEQLVIYDRGAYFDHKTGDKIIWDKWKCPNKKLFSFGHDTGSRLFGRDEIDIHISYD